MMVATFAFCIIIFFFSKKKTLLETHLSCRQLYAVKKGSYFTIILEDVLGLFLWIFQILK